MKSTAQKIQQDIAKKKIAPVYFFYGEEDFVTEQLCDWILEHVIEAESRDFNLQILYGNETDGTTIINAAKSFPMMAQRRVVIVKNMEALSQQSKELVLRYVKNPSQSTCVILVAGAIDARKTVYAELIKTAESFESKSVYDNKIPEWIRGHLSQDDILIDEEAIRALQATVGNSLRALASEIAKIRLNLADRKEIVVDDVVAVVGVSKNYTIFELCDAIGERNLAKSLHILSQMMQLGLSAPYLLTMLTRHFIILTRIRLLRMQKLANEKIIDSLRINRYFFDNYARQSGKFTLAQFQETFALLLETDQQLKSSYQKPRLILETMIFRIHLQTQKSTSE